MFDHISRISIRSLALAALVLQSACRRDHAHAAAPVVGFNALFGNVRVMTLATARDNPLLLATAAIVTDAEITVLDERAADVKVFARGTGALTRVLGRAGDGVGEFRRPIVVATLDSGRFVIFDQGRRVLSFRDSLGAVIQETLPIKGFFNGLVTLPAQRRVLLAGSTLNQTGDAKNTDLHEFDYDGHRVASYAKTVKPESNWASKISALFAAPLGSSIVTGSLNSNRLRFYDRSTHSEKWIDVAPDWYRPLEYPADRLLQRSVSTQTVAQRVQAWMHTQRLMNGVFPLTGGRLLVRFMAFTSPTDKAFYYAVADTTGRTYAVSQATRARVVAARADTVFWVNDGGANGSRLGSGVIDAAHLASLAPSTDQRRTVAAR